jgi:hypothetical protein
LRRIDTAEERAYYEKKDRKLLEKQNSDRSKETNFQKFISLIFTAEFAIEFIILAVHPFPGYEVRYDIPIIDML